MKYKLRYIRPLTVLVLLFIVVNQMVWIYNMYKSYKTGLRTSMERALEIASDKELTNRGEIGGGYYSFMTVPSKTDTTRFVVKDVQTEDTTFQVTIDRHDSRHVEKLLQFLHSIDLEVYRLNIYLLDSLFQQELTSRLYPELNTYIDYIDLKADSTISSSNYSVKYSSYIESDTLVLDIFNTIGVKAYVEEPTYTILRQMLFQLILSISLILLSAGFIFILVRTIIWQKKEENMRRDSINSMTHEFKRPINCALTMAALIPEYLQRSDEDKVDKYANDIVLELNKLTAYTNRIKQLSNNSKENIVLNKVDIEIEPFFKSIIEKYSSEKEKMIEFSLEISSVKQYIHADILHFSNVIENLVENAIKYSHDKVSIEIVVEDKDNKIKISIKDNGFGISDTDKNFIFEKYYRSKSKAVQKNVGFGLGLTYVKSIIDAHIGNIVVKSNIGNGSEFVLLL